MAGGWVKLHRSLLDWEWWDDFNTARVWIWLILSANHTPVRWRGTVLYAGQIATSYGSIAEKTGLTVREVRTAIDHLKSTKNVTCRATNRFQVITIANWAFFQDDCDLATGHASPTRQSNDRLTTTNKNDKNDKKERKKNTGDTPPKSPLGGSDPFTAYAGEDAELLDALREFEKMRKAIKRPMTQRAKQLLLTSLDGLSGDRGEKIAILEQSILNNWRGVYALKGGKGEDGRGSSAEKPAGDGKGGDSLRLKGVTYL